MGKSALTAGAMLPLAAAGIPALARAAATDSIAARLRTLEDRQALEELFVACGATLDRHDFAAFGNLFAEDAVYSSGPGAPQRATEQ